MSTRARIASVALVTALLAAAALPASAANTTYTIGSATCVANPTSSTYVTSTQNSSCNQVYAAHNYRDNNGTQYPQVAFSTSRASVSAPTAMITNRAHGVSITIMGTEKWLYFS